MKRFLLSFVSILFLTSFHKPEQQTSWIRVNQLGYATKGIKVGVWCSKDHPDGEAMGNLPAGRQGWQLVDAATNKVVYSARSAIFFGTYGPFLQTCRLDFSSFTKPGHYWLQVASTRSPEFEIGDNVYKGAADFCLRYMRQQRSGFNPFLKDSCHTHDGYVLYGEKAGLKDSTHIDVVGGWHDASDYLQYSATSANATYHLLMAYRDFPKVFTDQKLANGLDGKNGMADVLDEAKWGLDWLLKMHPKENLMFNQIADDRDHMGMRIPKEDSFYGKGYERPVYFINGEPQQRGKFLNNTTGTSSTAGKFAGAFSLGSQVFNTIDKPYSEILSDKAYTSTLYAMKRTGVTQTVSIRSPYIYAEDNWVDDLELAFAAYSQSSKIAFKKIDTAGFIKDPIYPFFIDQAIYYSKREPITPWLGKDTANHYQWYPFINLGHYELAKQLKGKQRDTIVGYYKEGIQRVWNKAKQNAFYRGIPFIWCSNNLTASFAIQCYWYRQLTGDKTFSELEQANFDWLFGCNPWGTSFVYGLPSQGDTPADPHSAFTHLRNYPIDGGLVDGPVYGSIYKNLIGITLYRPDEYAELQSNLAVYHDDYGDYSTNEPTMDGTASLIYLLAAKEVEATASSRNSITEKTSKNRPFGEVLGGVFSYDHGAIIRADSSKKQIALVFTGDEFEEGGNFIARTLNEQHINASFFLTGRFYQNPAFKEIVQQLKKQGNYLGPHSNQHLLYCDWTKRDSLLITKEDFTNDLLINLDVMHSTGVNMLNTKYFLPPYEWYNDSIAIWTQDLGLQLINYTPGTLSPADYTTPHDKNYRASVVIYNSIANYERSHPAGLNGFILLMHIGTDPKRTDKFYYRLPQLIKYLKQKHYHFKTIPGLLQ